MVDKIIITGCSHSTGIEMLDHLLGFPSSDVRRASIWKWYKKNEKNYKNISIEELDKKSSNFFHSLEREQSWPALLEKKSGVSVVNLSVCGGSIGRSLIEFSNYCRNHKINSKTIAIHQLPELGRFYMRFSDHKINIVPSLNFNDLGYDKKYFKKDIKKIEEKYKEIIKKDLKNDYIKKYYIKCINRIKKISEKYNIESFFICIKDININNTLIKDFETFRKKYKQSQTGHIIDTRFNEDITDIVLKKLHSVTD